MREDDGQSDVERLLALHERWIEANTAIDGERMRTILASDCRYFDVQGGCFDGVAEIVRFEESFRQIVTAHPEAPAGGLAVFTHASPPTVRVVGDAGWVTYLARMKGILGGAEVVIPLRGTEIYERRDEEWVMAHAHFSPHSAGAP